MNRGLITPLGLAHASGWDMNSGDALLFARQFDGYFRDNTIACSDVPNTATKLLTVPAGFACDPSFNAYNTTGSAITLQIFLADPSQTSVTLADRFVNTSIAANTYVAASTDGWLTEGWSYWAQASAATGLNIISTNVMMRDPNDTGAMRITQLILKPAPTSETLLYQCCTPEAVAAGLIGGTVHNTTAGSLTYTTKLKRATDATSFTINVQTIAANTQTTFMGGQGSSIMLSTGDAIYHLASGPGLNIATAYYERQKLGVELLEPFGLHP